MTRSCAYPGCDTGSNNERQRNKLLSCRNKTLFKFPKMGLPLREKWEKALGRPARDSEVICENHFSEENIARQYKIVMPNGFVEVLDRDRPRLDSDAVPIAVPNINLRDHNYATTKSILAKSVNENRNVDEKIVVNVKKDAENINLNIKNLNDLNVKNIVAKIDNNIVADVKKDTENIHSNIIVNKSIPPPLLWRLPPDQKEPPKTTPLTLISYKNKLETKAPEKLNNFKATPAQIEPEKKIDEWTLKVIYDKLQKVETKYKNWGAILLRDKVSIICFDAPMQPRKQIIIHEDLTYEVRVEKRATFIPGMKELSTLENILHNIRILQQIVPCDGPGDKDKFEKHSPSCSGYDKLEKLRHFGHHRHFRCFHCSELRKTNLRKRALDIKSRQKLQNRIKEMARTIKLTNAKMNRLKTRLESLQKTENI